MARPLMYKMMSKKGIKFLLNTKRNYVMRLHVGNTLANKMMSETGIKLVLNKKVC